MRQKKPTLKASMLQYLPTHPMDATCRIFCANFNARGLRAPRLFIHSIVCNISSESLWGWNVHVLVVVHIRIQCSKFGMRASNASHGPQIGVHDGEKRLWWRLWWWWWWCTFLDLFSPPCIGFR